MKFLYFRAAGCSVCVTKHPVAKQIAADLDLPFAEVDLDSAEGRADAERLRISTVPTLALVAGERVPFKVVGRRITPDAVRFLYQQFSQTRTETE